MKLYLSSYRLGNQPEAIRAVVGDGYRAGIIMNACDVFDERLMVWPREEADLRGLGFDVVELDLREHFSDRDGLNQRLETLDLLWVVGGNTFVLARAMDACGFAELARERVESGVLTYAGYSAGVCVLAPGLEGIELMDDADTIPAGYPPECQPRTLGWIPWRVVPHWSSPHAESPLADRAAAYLLDAELPFRTLRDGHAIVMDGAGTRVVGRA